MCHLLMPVWVSQSHAYLQTLLPGTKFSLLDPEAWVFLPLSRRKLENPNCVWFSKLCQKCCERRILCFAFAYRVFLFMGRDGFFWFLVLVPLFGPFCAFPLLIITMMFSQSNNFIYQPFFPSLFLIMDSSPFLPSDISESLKLRLCRYLFHS